MRHFTRFSKERWVIVAVVFIVATALGLLFASEGLFSAQTPANMAWSYLYWSLTTWYLWAAFVPVILWLVRRHPLDRTSWGRLAFIHIPASMVFGSLHYGIQLAIATLYHFAPKGIFLLFLTWRMALYLQIVVVCYAIDFARRRRQEELKSSQLKAKIAELQLQALKTQLRPAFLFDTLHCLSDLIEKDVEEADNTIALIGDFLRMTLENSGSKEIPVRDELNFLNCYLKIERTWLRERLDVDIRVDPDFLDAVIPNLLLQPIAECAIYNKKQNGPIRILLSIQSSNGFLQIKLQENVTSTVSDSDGVTDPRLTTIGERLQEIYGNDYEFRCHVVAQRTLDAEAKIPLHFSEVRNEMIPVNVPMSISEVDMMQRMQSADLPFVEPKPSGKLRRFLGIIGIWTAIGIYFSGRDLLEGLANPQEGVWSWLVLMWLRWLLWAALTPVVLAAADRFPLERPRLPVKLILHFVTSAVCYLIVSAGVSAGMFLSQNKEPYWTIWSNGLKSFAFALDVLVYWTIVAVHHAIRYYRQHQKIRFTAAQLELKLLQSQLQALHMQLHPHFLFNTLHSISELIHEDVPAAKKMLERLIHFLRFTLESSSLQQVPLEKEIEFLECYLQIQQVRFQERLLVKMQIEDRVKNLLVPNLVLQPIVENAIRYGIAPRTDSGVLEIKAGRKNCTLQLEVRDDGPGLRMFPLKEGLGLSNTRIRLQQMFGKAQSMTVQNAPEGGLQVILKMPVQTTDCYPGAQVPSLH